MTFEQRGCVQSHTPLRMRADSSLFARLMSVPKKDVRYRMTHPSFVRKGASLMQTRVMETPTDARSVAHFKRLRRSLVRACALNLIAQIALGTPIAAQVQRNSQSAPADHRREIFANGMSGARNSERLIGAAQKATSCVGRNANHNWERTP
jgi:hypothetical protein